MPSLCEATNGAAKCLMPGATIGIIGGGQLGRMMAIAARRMGFKIGVLDPAHNCPVFQVADFQVEAEYDDLEALQKLAKSCDVLTYEFENVNADALDSVRDLVAVPQGTDLLRVTQDRVFEKSFINNHGIETAKWREVNNLDDLDKAIEEIGLPAILKTRRGGYDGHGQDVLRTQEDVDNIRKRVENGQEMLPSILEGFVDFAFEASILVSGNGNEFVTYPLVKNVHHNSILHMTLAPANVDTKIQEAAHSLALKLAQGFKLAGTLGIELFITKDNRVVVNELAPRPHNSGHYTIEACDMDQFEAHVRGIVGWPLKEPTLLSAAVMVNVLGQHVVPTRALIAEHPEWHVHDYGKAEIRKNRKMGHITVLCNNPVEEANVLDSTGCWDDELD